MTSQAHPQPQFLPDKNPPMNPPRESPIILAAFDGPWEGGGTGSSAMGNLWQRRLPNLSESWADGQAAASPAVVSVSTSSTTISQPWETA